MERATRTHGVCFDWSFGSMQEWEMCVERGVNACTRDMHLRGMNEWMAKDRRCSRTDSSTLFTSRNQNPVRNAVLHAQSDIVSSLLSHRIPSSLALSVLALGFCGAILPRAAFFHPILPTTSRKQMDRVHVSPVSQEESPPVCSTVSPAGT